MKYFVLALILASRVSYAQSEWTPAEALENSRLDKNPKLFFDAQTTGMSRDGKKQMFSGQVVAIGSGLLITADKVEVDRVKQVMSCSGHVIILTRQQVFIGESIEYQMGTGNFVFNDAIMISNDNKEADKLAKNILGFSVEELAFETRRKQQLKSIDLLKEDLRIEMRNQESGPVEAADAIVNRYAALLEREDLTNTQENPVLAKMDSRRREIFKSRRKFWNQSYLPPESRRKTAYFRMEGRILERVDDTVFKAQEAVWSPCNCDEDESPAWGFRADRIEARSGGYVDLYHPVLEIRGIPILYFPFLKLPMKTKRQSGFLMPRFADERASGTIYSQPVYFALNEQSDATLTTDLYENRGTKLGLEYRYQAKRYSQWTLQIEKMRDRLWLDDRAVRKDILVSFDSLPEDERSQTKKNEMLGALASPSNTWRGRKSWSVLQILAPRLSFVSTGSILSDHRYIEDLTLPDAYKDSFELGHNATYFSPASARFHLDNRNFYLGLGSDFGDNVRTNRSFDGFQLPARMKLMSRMYSLIPENSLGIRGYGQLSLDHRQIMDYNADLKSNIGENQGLGSGYWEQLRFDYTSPLVSESVVTVSHFAEAEFRKIKHEGLSVEDSHIHSWRTGLRFSLPLDGQSVLPEWLQGNNENHERHLHHLMDWGLTFSVRPVVSRRGPYFTKQIGANGNSVGPFSYFYSDTDVYNTNFDDASDEESMMKVHRRIKLDTSHRWRSFLRGWKTLEAKNPKVSSDGAKLSTDTLSYKQKAKRELIYALDRPVEGADDMFGEIQDDYVWYINRYRLEDYSSSEHVTFDADISYDFENEKIRNEQKKDPDFESKDDAEKEAFLVDSWSELNTDLRVNAASMTLRNINKYNTYTDKFSRMTFTLGLPPFVRSRVSFGYTISQDPDSKGVYKQTTEQLMNLTTKVFSHLDLGVSLAKRLREESDPEYQTIFRISYTSLEDCWKVDLGRTKSFEKDERDAVYLLQLSVLFLGQERRVGNLGDQVERYIDSDSEG
ncbi:putative LPS assembly protein LptD [Oligoflexaceae bacterium]|nr:putative LPS assembly protein LptD [Oligoflexaceae bacterium]